MNKIYLVTSGAYSDYKVDRAFSTKEKAEDYISLINERDRSCGNIGIQEFDLDIKSEKPFSGLCVCMNLDDGSIHGMDRKNPRIFEWVFRLTPERENDIPSFIFEKNIKISADKKDYLPDSFGHIPRPYLEINFDHTDKERAIKIASEKRFALIATYGAIENLEEGEYDRDTLQRI